MFSVELHWVILAIFVFATLVFLVIDPKLREWQHRRRKKKAAALLQAEFDRRAHEVDVAGRLRSKQLTRDLADVQWERDALLHEVEMLTRRAELLANAARADDYSKTQVLRPVSSSRFTKKSS